MLTALTLVFFFTAVMLRPYLPHRRHKASYLLLKISYLIYLLILFAFLYFLTFYPRSLEELFTNTLSFTLLVTLFLPSAAMLARKKVRKKRSFYNYFFTIFHLATAGFYILIWNKILSLYG